MQGGSNLRAKGQAKMKAKGIKDVIHTHWLGWHRQRCLACIPGFETGNSKSERADTRIPVANGHVSSAETLDHTIGR